MRGRFKKAMSAFPRGDVNYPTDDMRVILGRVALYTPNFDTHQYLSSVPLGARESVATLTNKAILDDAVLDADDPVFTAVTGPAGDRFLIYYKHTGDEGTSLIFIYDDEVTDLPTIALTNNTVTIELPNTDDRIARL